MMEKNLMESLTNAIKDREFNILEMTGFKVDPNLALLAGATIGYRFALDNIDTLFWNNGKIGSVEKK